jgi:hypothetical protein
VEQRDNTYHQERCRLIGRGDKRVTIAGLVIGHIRLLLSTDRVPQADEKMADGIPPPPRAGRDRGELVVLLRVDLGFRSERRIDAGFVCEDRGCGRLLQLSVLALGLNCQRGADQLRGAMVSSRKRAERSQTEHFGRRARRKLEPGVGERFRVGHKENVGSP